MNALRPRSLAVLVLAPLCLCGCKGGCQQVVSQSSELRKGLGELEGVLTEQEKEDFRKSLRGLGETLDPSQLKNRVVSARNLRRIAEAIRKYHDGHGHYPPAALSDNDGKPLLSWRVLILPQLGEQALYDEFRLDEPWDGPNNVKLLPRMPEVYAAPGTNPPEPHMTYYKAFTGPGSLFEEGSKVTKDDVRDGLHQTVIVVEAGEPCPWTKPEDVRVVPGEPLAKLGCYPGLFHAVTGTGALIGYLVPASQAEEKDLRARVTRGGGEVIREGDWDD
jgi:hypothetical protein